MQEVVDKFLAVVIGGEEEEEENCNRVFVFVKKFPLFLN